MVTAMKTPHRRYLRLTIALVLAGLGAVVALNAVVDPFGVYPSVHFESLDPYRSGRASRTGRAALLLRGDAQTILMGSSKVEVGLDPLDPALGGHVTYNVGLSHTHLSELPSVFALALRHNPDLRRILLAVDFRMVRRKLPSNADFDLSALNQDISGIEYQTDKLVSHRAVKGSIETLARWALGRPAGSTPQGHFNRFRTSRHPQEIFARELQAVYRRAYAEMKYDPSMVERVHEMLDLAQRANVRVDVVILPTHPTLLSMIRLSDNWENFERFKRDLTRVVAESGGGTESGASLWDFSGWQHGLSDPLPPLADKDARMKHFWDPSHFRSEVGGRVLAEIYSVRSEGRQDAGVILAPQNVEGHLAKLRRDEYAFSRRHQEVANFVGRQIAESH